MIKLKDCMEKTINLLAYIAWSLSLWMLSYYQISKCNFGDVGESYFKAFWWLMLAIIILYGCSWKELLYEILRSVSILGVSLALNMIYYQNGSINEVIERVVIVNDINFCA